MINGPAEKVLFFIFGIKKLLRLLHFQRSFPDLTWGGVPIPYSKALYHEKAKFKMKN